MKEPSTLKWVEDLLPKGYRRKTMFGGFGYYLDELLILLTFESSGNTKFKDQIFDFELWNGCMFPAEKENHPKIKELFPFLINHPILPKWLYLPIQSENFDQNVEDIMISIKRKSSLFGTIPNRKKTAAKERTAKGTAASGKVKVAKLNQNEKIDLRKPQMFSGEPAQITLAKAKSIADLKNLGPATQITMAKAGIKTAQQFIKLGWRKTMVKLVAVNPKNRHSLFAYALIGALTNTEWFGISDDEKKEAREFTASLKPKKKVSAKVKTIAKTKKKKK